jgi:hypothetical protein
MCGSKLRVGIFCAQRPVDRSYLTLQPFAVRAHNLFGATAIGTLRPVLLIAISKLSRVRGRVSEAIENALQGAEQEREGLLAGGSTTSWHALRLPWAMEPMNTWTANQSIVTIKTFSGSRFQMAKQRLKERTTTIAHSVFLKVVVRIRFADM